MKTMSVQEYYNILPMKSPTPSPTTSVDSGVLVEEQKDCSSAPEKPPRVKVDPPEHAYHNLPPYPVDKNKNKAKILDSCRRAITPPPRLPKRQPLVTRPKTPPLPARRPLNGIMNVYNNTKNFNFYSSPQISSVSSVGSAATSYNSCRPFRQRFQVKKRGAGGQCNCKTTLDDEGEMARDDVILLYSRHCSGSKEWANYLNKLYTELSKHKGKLKVRHLPLEDVTEATLPAFIEDEIYHSRLQIVLLSPTFLDFALRLPSVMVGRLFNPDRVLAIMLGVKDSEINLDHRTFLVSFSQWVHLEAKDHDLEFVQTVLYFSTHILQKSVDRPSRKQCLQKQKSFNGQFECNFFHIHPRRVTEGQNRVILIFEAPQSQQSQFLVSLKRSQFDLPDIILKDVNLKNQFNLQVIIPGCCFSTSYLTGIRLEIDGINCGFRTLKIESTMSELGQILKGIQDPVEFMCQNAKELRKAVKEVQFQLHTWGDEGLGALHRLGWDKSIGLGSSCKDKLDERLTREFLFNTPRGFQLLKSTDLSLIEMFTAAVKDFSEFPTLLHFAACHGFERLTTILLECPGAKEASTLRNSSDLNPTELAQINGHINLARQLHAFQNGALNSSHIYDYIFQSRKSQSPQKSLEHCPYQIPPPPRPVLKEKPTIKTKEEKVASLVPQPQNGFETLHSSVQDESNGDDEVFHKSLVQSDEIFGTLKAANQSMNQPKQSLTIKASKDDNKKIQPRNQQLEGGEVTLADELLKLLDNFQKKSYSAKEMEEMFENWKKKAQINLRETPPFQDTKLSIDPQKVKGHKALNTLLKLFHRKFSNEAIKKDTKTSESMTNSNIKIFSTLPKKDLKDFSQTDPVCEIIDVKIMPGNETNIEAEKSILDEESMNVIVFPPTPDKTPPKLMDRDDGISTQILPLSRLSLSGSSNSSSFQSNLESSPKFPDNQLGLDKNESLSMPGSRMMEKFKKSPLTEPLIYYFHELNAGSDMEEPEILNTPKSVAPPNDSLNSSNKSQLCNEKKSSKNLFHLKKDCLVNTTYETYKTSPDMYIECHTKKKFPSPTSTDM